MKRLFLLLLCLSLTACTLNGFRDRYDTMRPDGRVEGPTKLYDGRYEGEYVVYGGIDQACVGTGTFGMVVREGELIGFDYKPWKGQVVSGGFDPYGGFHGGVKSPVEVSTDLVRGQ